MAGGEKKKRTRGRTENTSLLVPVQGPRQTLVGCLVNESGDVGRRFCLHLHLRPIFTLYLNGVDLLATLS